MKHTKLLLPLAGLLLAGLLSACAGSDGGDAGAGQGATTAPTYLGRRTTGQLGPGRPAGSTAAAAPVSRGPLVWPRSSRPPDPQARYRPASAGRYRLRSSWSGRAMSQMRIASQGRTKASGSESANSSTGSSDVRTAHR